MRRVQIIGTSGNGKSTLGRALAARLAVPYVELDALFHGPNWAEPGAAEFRARVEPVVAGDGWVIDGNYDRKLDDLVFDSADTIVWLDQPLRVILPRLWRRTIRRLRTHEELWNGNRETWRAAFWGRESLFAWTLRSHFRLRRELPGKLAGRNLVRLRSPRAVERFLSDAAAP